MWVHRQFSTLVIVPKPVQSVYFAPFFFLLRMDLSGKIIGPEEETGGGENFAGIVWPEIFIPHR